MNYLKMKRGRLFGANKRRKPWKAIIYFRTYSNRILGKIVCLERSVLWRIDVLFIKDSMSSEEITLISYICFSKPFDLPPILQE